MIIGIACDRGHDELPKVTLWYLQTKQKLAKYGGGGFLGKTNLYEVYKPREHLFLFSYKPMAPLVRPVYVGLFICALAFLFSWHWSSYIVAGLFASMEFFLSKWLVYYVMAMSLTKKTGVKKYRVIHAEEVLEDMLDSRSSVVI